MTSPRASTMAAVALGGALGTATRDAIGQWIEIAPHGFPTPILLVNLAGALALGLAHAAVLPAHNHLRPFLAVGFLGSFTTFGTVMVGVVDLQRLDAGPTAWSYLAVTVIGGLAAAWAGLRIGAALAPTRTTAP